MAKNSYSYEQIISDLQKKIFHPIYFFHGDEPYYIDKLCNYILENVLTENEKAFNQTILYGKDSDAGLILGAAKRFPMMSANQVVMVKEAQDIKNFDDLIYYIENPLKSTLLILNYKYKSPDKRKKVFKSIQEKAVMFESKKLYDDKIPDWITAALKTKNYKIEPKAAIILTEFLGNDLAKIENELEKLIITMPDNVRLVTPDHIERNIGISKEYNNFELQKALTEKNVLKANMIIKYFAANPKNNPITVTITSLYFFFSKILTYQYLTDKSISNAASALKINPFFVQDYEKAARTFSAGKVVKIISYLREYDVKSKGYGSISADDGDLMKELVFKILH